MFATVKLFGRWPGERRYIPIGPLLMECIKAELAGRKGTAPNEPLFLNKYRRRHKDMRGSLEGACERDRVRVRNHAGTSVEWTMTVGAAPFGGRLRFGMRPESPRRRDRKR